MAIQLSSAVRTAMAGTFEGAVGASPTLEIRSGAAPASCAAADAGAILVSMVLPADWLGAAAGGAVSLAGVWQDAEADASGTAGHYRIKQGATCHAQGSVSQRAADGGNGDLQLSQATAAIVAGQQVSINSWTLTVGGA